MLHRSVNQKLSRWYFRDLPAFIQFHPFWQDERHWLKCRCSLLHLSAEPLVHVIDNLNQKCQIWNRHSISPVAAAFHCSSGFHWTQDEASVNTDHVMDQMHLQSCVRALLRYFPISLDFQIVFVCCRYIFRLATTLSSTYVVSSVYF